MGGDLPGMVERLEYLVSLWQRGVRANHLIFLTADRPLDPIHESVDKIKATSGKNGLANT